MGVKDTNLFVADARERIIDIFQEETEKDPQLARNLDQYLISVVEKGKARNASDKYYNNALSILFEALQAPYELLDEEHRQTPLHHAVSFLSFSQPSLAKHIVKHIGSPELASDICLNIPRATPRQPYKQDLKGKTWEYFEEAYFKHRDNADIAVPAFWLAKAVLLQTTPDSIRANFSEVFPELTDATLTGIAGIIDTESRRKATTIGQYNHQLANRIRPYHLVHHEDIRERIEARQWTVLYQTAEEFKFLD